MSCDTSTLDYQKGVMLYQSYKRPHMPSTAAKPKGVEEGSAAVKGVKGKKSFEATLKESAERVREELPVFDVRPAHGQFNIDVHGFITAHMTTAMPQTLEVISDKDETEIRKTYWPEVEALARRTVTTNDGRSPKYAFAVGTQKFVPLTREEASKIDDPFGALSATYARIAHADFSEVVFDGAWKMLAKRGVPEKEAKDDLDVMFVNCWKPFGQTVRDNPFAILDWSSVDVDNDVHIVPRGSPTTRGAIYGTGITFNSDHRWVYLPEQRDDELWLFKQADSRAVNKQPHSLAQFGFHQAWKLPDDPGSENKTRRSLALRLVLAFEKQQQPSSKL